LIRSGGGIVVELKKIEPNTMKEKLTILLLDDEPNNIYSLNGYLRREFNILSFTKVSDALEYLEKQEIHIIIADQKIPQMLGLDFLNICRKVKPNAFRI
jgi:two-component system, sensor histidine kinase and response regulator